MGAAKRKWAVAAASAMLALAGCGPKVKTSGINTDQASALCAAMDTSAAVKGLVFDAAQKQTAPANRLALGQLAKQASLRIERPLLDSYDEDTRKTTCSGQLHLNLPPGAVRNLGDTSDLTASIKYSAEPSGSGGLDYQLTGAEALTSGIAGADISAWASQLQPAGMPVEGAPVPAAAPGAQPTASMGPAMQPPATPVAAPTTAPPRGPTRTAESGPCRNARTWADHVICSDPELYAEDRHVAALYREALASDPTGEVRRVYQAERPVRDGCQDRECIVEWFKQREADLSGR